MNASKHNIIFFSEKDRLNAFSLCKGSYQQSLIEGQSRWSGSDLKGKAKKFGAKYSRSRNRLVQRMADAGMKLKFVYAEKNKKILLVNFPE